MYVYMDIHLLIKRIEPMKKENQICVLKWFANKSVLLSKNKNGVFNNLNGMTDDSIASLDLYVQSLEKTEMKKENLFDWL